MSPQIVLFLVLVGVTVFLLTVALTVPVYGTGARNMKATRARVRNIIQNMSEETRTILRERARKDLFSWERALERIPQVEHIARMLEQDGITTPASRFLLVSAAIGLAAGFAIQGLTGIATASIIIGLISSTIPTGILVYRRDRRLIEFESQLPDALSMISRALRAGLPFMDALKIASQEAPDPIGEEFRITFADMNYGMGMKDGFLNLMTRVPSVSLTTMVTAVLIQRESGGNLAEILDKVAEVIRSRYKLQRRVMTLSAEARMSAWVLALMPLALAAALFVSAPSYLPRLINDPMGPKLIGYAILGMFVGILWMRRIIRMKL